MIVRVRRSGGALVKTDDGQRIELTCKQVQMLLDTAFDKIPSGSRRFIGYMCDKKMFDMDGDVAHLTELGDAITKELQRQRRERTFKTHLFGGK